MKELEKIQNISVASTLFILVVIIGLLTYKKPKNTFKLNTKTTLENITTGRFFVNQNNLDHTNYALIDIRSPYEFQKGHLKNAKNIYTPELLNDTHLDYFNSLKNQGKTAVLYGNNPEEANAPFLVLYQLGYNNLKLLKAEQHYFQNKLITTPVEVESSQADVAAFIKESVKNSDANAEINVISPVKKVITVQPKKKKHAEGGC